MALLPLRTARNSVRFFVSSQLLHRKLILRWEIIATQKDVDGFLVGGASLKPEFVDIINATKA